MTFDKPCHDVANTINHYRCTLTLSGWDPVGTVITCYMLMIIEILGTIACFIVHATYKTFALAMTVITSTVNRGYFERFLRSTLNIFYVN